MEILEDLDTVMSGCRINDHQRNLQLVLRALQETNMNTVAVDTNKPEDVIQEELR
jgi:hypothetical protein